MRRYGRNIYNPKDKLNVLKLNGFERFPGKLFTSAIVMWDFKRDEIQKWRDPSEMARECWYRALANLIKTYSFTSRESEFYTETIKTTSQYD